MENTEPLVSIVIPVYKVEEYLNQCIDSAVHQTYKNLEIILVDDGSPDKCSDICDQWAKNDSRIVVIHKDNGGVSDARNEGMLAATGEYIYFADSDDYFDSNLIDVVIRKAILNKSEMVFIRYRVVDVNGKVVSSYAENYPQEGVYSSKETLRFIWTGRIPNYPWGYFFKKEIMSSHNILFPLDRIMGEDLAMMHLLVNSAKKIYFVDKKLYCYRQRAGSVLSDKSLRVARDYAASVKDVSDYSSIHYQDMIIDQRNWAIKNTIAALIWAYRDRHNADNLDYLSFVSTVSNYINQFVRDIGLRQLSIMTLFEYVLIRFRMYWLINLLFSLHHKLEDI